MSACILGIDVGTTTIKAVLFDQRGFVVDSASQEYPIYFPKRGWVEQNPDEWWQHVQILLQQLTAANQHEILAVGVSSQAPSFIPMAKDGTPLDQALIWMDRRADAEADWLKERFTEEKVLHYSQNRVDSFYTAAKLLWYKGHRREKYSQLFKVLQVNGYINFKLTGKYTLDQAHASITQLYDLNRGEWASDIMEQCGLNPGLFPPVYDCSEIIGEITPEAARATGLKAAIPVIAGTVDGAAAALEAGVIAPGTAAEMSGTSSVLILSAEQVESSKELITMKHAFPHLTLHLGAMTSTGASLKWFRDQFCPLEMKQGEQEKKDAYELMSEQVEQHSAQTEVVFLPYMMGERSPLWDSYARGVFFGLSLHTSKADMIRAVMEGSAFALRHNVEVARQAGLEIKQLRLIGGAANSDCWNQIKADVLQREVEVLTGAGGAPLGNAILAGLAVGFYSSAQAVLDEVLSRPQKVTPSKEMGTYYHKKYAIFLKLYAQLKEQYVQLAGIMEEE